MVGADSQISVVIRKRDGIVFSGSAWAISSINAVGPFDVLLRHANFVSVVVRRVIVHTSGSDRTIDFDRGVMRVFENVVEVYVGI